MILLENHGSKSSSSSSEEEIQPLRRSTRERKPMSEHWKITALLTEPVVNEEPGPL